EQLREADAVGENQYTETQHQLLLETAALDKDDITVNSVFSNEEEEKDNTVALLLKLEKIKKEHAEKKKRMELEKMESAKHELSHFYFLNTTIYIIVVSMNEKD
ncbi:438_t:CDS:2, partial [Gigaspora margarita]